MMGPGYGYGFGGCGLFIFIGILALGFFIYYIMKSQKKQGTVNQADETKALDLLNERLARGEISPEEYQEIKKAITK